MPKALLIGVVVWLILFLVRVLTVGGLDPTYRDSEVELFKPFRARLVKTVGEILPYPQSALLSGIILGSQENLPLTLKNNLKATSTIHMVVVSGQNLTMAAGFIMSLVTFLGRKKTVILTLFVILLYSLLTGFQVPVIRATLMVGIAFLAQLLGRDRVGWWVLGLVAGGMLLYNPHWLLNISFQLSFLATLGVVVVSPLVVDHLKVVPGILRQDLGVTLSAQALVLPIIAYNFSQISLIGILVNILILWSIPIVMISGFVSLLVGLFWIGLGQLVGLIPGILLTYFIYLVEFFAKVPGASLGVGQTGLVVWIGYYLMVGAAIWGMGMRRRYEVN